MVPLQPILTQPVAVGASSTQSAAFTAYTKTVRLIANTDCYVAFGSNPTASTSSLFLPAGSIEYFRVQPGSQIAVIQSTLAGTLNLSEMTQ
jgi:hypothetical protein